MRAAAGKAQDFDCPVCHARSTVHLPYNLPDGSQRQGSFYRCRQCDFGFTDPLLFKKKKRPRVG